MQMVKQEHPKISEDLGKINNEDSEGLKKIYRGRNFVLMSQGILHGSTPKRTEKRIIRARNALTCA